MSTRKHSIELTPERRNERKEARFYYVVLMPVCLIASVISMISATATGARASEMNSPFSIWSKARAQANTIVPFIMMK